MLRHFLITSSAISMAVSFAVFAGDPNYRAPVSVSASGLESIQRSIIHIKEQSKINPDKDLKTVVSDPKGEVQRTVIDNIKPPKGAFSYPDISDKDFVSVKTEQIRVSRDQPKVAADKSAKPEPPKAWRQLGFASQIQPIEKGIDKNLLSAYQRIRDRKFTYAFMIINEYLTDDVTKELRGMGVEILGPHASAYKVKLPLKPKVLQRIAKAPYVEWLGYSLPSQKLDNELGLSLKKYQKVLKEVPVWLNFFDAEAVERYAKTLQKREITLGRYHKDLQAYSAVVPVESLEWLTAQDYILFVELDTPTYGGHDQSMASMGVDYLRSGGGGTNFTGASTILGIMDTGFMVGSSAATMHRDLNKFGCGKNFSSDTAGVWNDEHDHGTHVLGTIAGTGTADARYRGVATGVGSSSTTRIRAAKVWNSNNSGTLAAMMDAMDYLAEDTRCNSDRPKVVNVSGGATGNGLTGTSALSRKLDEKVWEHKQAYIVCGGNTGSAAQTIWDPGVAKNAFAVGNALDSGDGTIGDINGGSSRGPTGDGRMKPNVVGTGTSIDSADAGTTNGYRGMSGCSMATPHVSGIAATLMEHYSAFQDRPYLLRAHLMASAILHDDTTNPANNTSGGRNTYGLGRVSTYASHWARSGNNGWSGHWATRTITNNNWGYRDIDVPSGTDRLVVVLTWDEPAASSGASQAVDYDLDLWVDRDADCAPDAKGQCGEWASQSWDDNTEYLIIETPSAGTYRLKMINWNAPSSGIPAAISAMVIKGDTTPSMALTASPSSASPAVGSVVTVTTTVSNPAYIASGVYLERSNLPAGLSFQGVSTTREDGVTMDFTRNSLSLGNIIQGDSRSATWSFLVTSAGTKTINFKARSENGGTQTRSVVLTP